MAKTVIEHARFCGGVILVRNIGTYWRGNTKLMMKFPIAVEVGGKYNTRHSRDQSSDCPLELAVC